MKQRAPFQVLVLPFRRDPDCSIRFAIFCRKDRGYWQGIAGGGEGDESPLEAAQRESAEEAGLPGSIPYYPLQTTNSIPTIHFSARNLWPRELYVIPEYCFGADAAGISIVLSSEHSHVRWTSFEEANQLLHWQSNRVALWELAQRLKDATLSG